MLIIFHFLCARPLSPTLTFLPPLPTRLLCQVVAICLVCWSYMCACVCVPLYVRLESVFKMMNINKYKPNCDDVTCNIKVETEIDVHSDVKQAVKWHVLRHVTEYNTNKLNTINVSVFQTLGGSWIVIPSLPSWVHYRLTSPSFDALWACVPLQISLHVHTVPNDLPRSLSGSPR